MHSLNEVNEKMQADTPCYQDSPRDYSDPIPTMGTQRKTWGHAESIRNRLARSNEEQQTLSRALRILEQHPEYEDLIWLIRSGAV